MNKSLKFVSLLIEMLEYQKKHDGSFFLVFSFLLVYMFILIHCLTLIVIVYILIFTFWYDLIRIIFVPFIFSLLYLSDIVTVFLSYLYLNPWIYILFYLRNVVLFYDKHCFS